MRFKILHYVCTFEIITEASRLVNTGRCWENGAPEEGMEFMAPFPPYLALCISSIWLILSYILYNKLVIASEAMPECCEKFQESIEPEKGVTGTPNL